MTQFVRHFLEETINLQPPGITNTYNEIGGDGTTQVVTPAAVPKWLGDRYLRAAGLSSTVNYRSAISFDAVNADASRADAQILFRNFNASDANNVRKFAVGVRCSGTYSSWTGYFFEVRRVDFSHVSLAIVKGVAATDTDLVTTGSLALALRVPYWLLVECRGTTLRMKFWTGEITDIPGAWTLTTTDAVISAAGAITFGGKVTAAGSAGIDLDFFSIGTGTDDAPAPPKTYAEFQAFLDLQDALRCVLVEIDPLGQDSAGAALSGRVCMANMPFVSRAMDKYPHTCYEEILLDAPKNRRRMNELFRGRSTISYGDVVFANEVVGENAAGFVGRLDPWFNWNWDGRAIRELYGHPTWRRCDFRTIMSGLVDRIDRAGYGRSVFKIKGQDGALMRPLTTATIGGTGPNASALMPFTGGFFFNVDVTSLLYDQATLTYQVFSPGNGFLVAGDFFVVRDSGGSLNLAPRTVSSVDTGTETITADAAHNLVANATVVFTAGTPPSPLQLATKYYVITAGLTSTAFRLSATRGGSAINLTTTTAGAAFSGRLYDWDEAGKISLLSNPAGRITVDAGFRNVNAYQLAVFGSGAGAIAFDAYHGAQPFAGNPPQIMGDWVQEQRTRGEEIDRIYQSVGASWQFTREGGLYSVVLDIPGAATLSAITSDDIRNWRKGTTILPAEVERLGYAKNFTIQKDGLLSSVTPTNRDLYGKPYSLTGYTASESGLEQPANHLLRRSPPERETLMMNASEALTESTRLYNLYRKTCGTYLFDTGAWAFTAEIGDILPITHPRDGFENGKNVVIVGIGNEDPARGTLELEVFCQIDGAWPVVSTAQPFASEAYY